MNYINRILYAVILTHRADSVHTELGFLPALVVPNLPEAQKIYPLIITVIIFILLQCHNIVQMYGSMVRMSAEDHTKSGRNVLHLHLTDFCAREVTDA